MRELWTDYAIRIQNSLSIDLSRSEVTMGRRWTDADMSDLKRLARRHPIPEVAEIMDRTVGSIAFKAHELKILLLTRQQAQTASRD